MNCPWCYSTDCYGYCQGKLPDTTCSFEYKYICNNCSRKFTIFPNSCSYCAGRSFKEIKKENLQSSHPSSAKDSVSTTTNNSKTKTTTDKTAKIFYNKNCFHCGIVTNYYLKPEWLRHRSKTCDNCKNDLIWQAKPEKTDVETISKVEIIVEPEKVVETQFVEPLKSVEPEFVEPIESQKENVEPCLSFTNLENSITDFYNLVNKYSATSQESQQIEEKEEANNILYQILQRTSKNLREHLQETEDRLQLPKKEQEVQIIQLTIPLLNWTNINSNFTPELIQTWINHNFTYQQVREWINTNSPNQQEQALQEPAFYAWLRDVKNLTPEKVLNYGDTQVLKQEFQQSLKKTFLIKLREHIQETENKLELSEQTVQIIQQQPFPSSSKPK